MLLTYFDHFAHDSVEISSTSVSSPSKAAVDSFPSWKKLWQPLIPLAFCSRFPVLNHHLNFHQASVAASHEVGLSEGLTFPNSLSALSQVTFTNCLFVNGG